MKTNGKRNLIKWLLALVITILCLFFIGFKIGWQPIKNQIIYSNKIFLAYALVSFVISRIFSAIRLHIYFSNIHINLSLIQNLKLYWLGMFFNLLMPGKIGGDSCKILLLSQENGVSQSAISSAILLDRIIGFIGWINLIAGIFSFLNKADILALVMIIGLLPLVVIYYFIHSNVMKADLAIFSFIIATFLAFVSQSFQLASVFFIIKSLGIEDHQGSYIILFSLSYLLASLPIAIGSLGIRELLIFSGSFIITLDGVKSITISLLYYLITVLVSLPGLQWKNNTAFLRRD